MRARLGGRGVDWLCRFKVKFDGACGRWCVRSWSDVPPEPLSDVQVKQKNKKQKINKNQQSIFTLRGAGNSFLLLYLFFRYGRHGSILKKLCDCFFGLFISLGADRRRWRVCGQVGCIRSTHGNTAGTR